MNTHDPNHDIPNTGSDSPDHLSFTNAEGLQSIAGLLDRLGAADRCRWTAADSQRIAASTADLLAGDESVIAVIDRDAAERFARRGLTGKRWWSGLAMAAAIALVSGIGFVLWNPAHNTHAPTGSPLAMNTNAGASLSQKAVTAPSSAALDSELEEELSAWLSSTVRLDPLALLSSAGQSDASDSTWAADSLDELETDLASFWTMGSGFSREAAVDSEGML